MANLDDPEMSAVLSNSSIDTSVVIANTSTPNGSRASIDTSVDADSHTSTSPIFAQTASPIIAHINNGLFSSQATEYDVSGDNLPTLADDTLTTEDSKNDTDAEDSVSVDSLPTFLESGTLSDESVQESESKSSEKTESDDTRSVNARINRRSTLRRSSSLSSLTSLAVTVTDAELLKVSTCSKQCGRPDTEECMILCKTCTTQQHYSCTQLPLYQLYAFKKYSRKYECSNCIEVPSEFVHSVTPSSDSLVKIIRDLESNVISAIRAGNDQTSSLKLTKLMSDYIEVKKRLAVQIKDNSKKKKVPTATLR